MHKNCIVSCVVAGNRRVLVTETAEAPTVLGKELVKIIMYSLVLDQVVVMCFADMVQTSLSVDN